MHIRKGLTAQSPIQAGQFRRLFQVIHHTASEAYQCAVETDPEEPHQSVNEKNLIRRIYPHSSKNTRFEEECNEYHDDNFMSYEERVELWYTMSETNALKDNARSFVKDIIKIEKGQDKSLSYSGVFFQVYDRFCTLEPTTSCSSAEEVATADDSYKLLTWMSIASDRWGLERLSVRKIHGDRSMRRKRNVRVVLEMQSMMESLDVDVRANYLRKASEHITRPSALFAQFIAQAQATALSREDGIR